MARSTQKPSLIPRAPNPPPPNPYYPRQPQPSQQEQELGVPNLLHPRPFYPPNPKQPIPNSNRPTLWFHNQRAPAPLFGFQNRPTLDPGSPHLGFVPPPNHHLHQMLLRNSSLPTLLKGLPISKMGSNQAPVIQNNGVKEARERSRDDSFILVRDRKVRISENSSLYSLCRSWLRNGLPEETEPQYIDIVKSLPRPLPLAPQDSQSPGKKEVQEEDEEEEGGGFVEHLSPQDLLQKHIKRAKRVRSRLREERLRRIARYKTRLSLLLPPIVEQHYRNESTAGNGNTS